MADGAVPGGFQAPGRGRYLTLFPDNARVLVENGCMVTVEPSPGADLTDARSILMAPVQAVLWHQRGLLPLHASVVGVNGRAVALAGPSGAGKSTLAAVLAMMGHEVLADDICIIDATNGADVLSGTCRLRLWRDALDHLGIAIDGLPRALSRSEKYLIESGGGDAPDRQPLAAVVLLVRQPGDAVTLERLRGARSIIALQEMVHMRDAARALGLGPEIFKALTRLTTLGVTAWRLAMPDDRHYLDEAAAKVLSVVPGG